MPRVRSAGSPLYSPVVGPPNQTAARVMLAVSVCMAIALLAVLYLSIGLSTETARGVAFGCAVITMTLAALSALIAGRQCRAVPQRVGLVLMAIAAATPVAALVSVAVFFQLQWLNPGPGRWSILYFLFILGTPLSILLVLLALLAPPYRTGIAVAWALPVSVGAFTVASLMMWFSYLPT